MTKEPYRSARYKDDTRNEYEQSDANYSPMSASRPSCAPIDRLVTTVLAEASKVAIIEKAEEVSDSDHFTV